MVLEGLDGFNKESLDFFITTHRYGLTDERLNRLRDIGEQIQSYKSQLDNNCEGARQLAKVETYFRMYCLQKGVKEKDMLGPKPQVETRHVPKAGWLRKLGLAGLAVLVFSGSCYYTNVNKTAAKSLPNGNQSYVIQKGDTLEKISKKYYGNKAYAGTIYKFNKKLDPNFGVTIYENQKIVLPARD